MKITTAQLKEIFPDANSKVLSSIVEPLNKAMEEFEINTPLRCAAFVAQCAHESDLFTEEVENLNYSAKGLMNTWPKRFPNLELANQYARQPQKIANFVYSSRMGNGDEASNDGWNFRGRGFIQITGKESYIACGKKLGIDLVKDPSYLETVEGACRSAGWFWQWKKLNKPADEKDILKMTKLINGGTIGLQSRTDYYNRALKVLDKAIPEEPKVDPVVVLEEPKVDPVVGVAHNNCGTPECCGQCNTETGTPVATTQPAVTPTVQATPSEVQSLAEVFAGAFKWFAGLFTKKKN